MHHKKLRPDADSRELSLPEEAHHKIIHHGECRCNNALNGNRRGDPQQFSVQILALRLHIRILTFKKQLNNMKILGFRMRLMISRRKFSI